MNTRDAILATANLLESKPFLFDYDCIGVPENTCDSPGCAIGWMNYFTQTRDDHVIQGSRLSNNSNGRFGMEPVKALGVEDVVFYARMRVFSLEWHGNVKECVRALRLYADKHHPAEKPPRNFARELMAALPAERIPDEVAL